MFKSWGICAYICLFTLCLWACGSGSSEGIGELPPALLPDTDEESAKVAPVVIGYIQTDDWEFDKMLPTVDWKALTHVNLCFARVKADGTVDVSHIAQRLKKVRDLARAQGVKVLISLAKAKKGSFAAAISDPQARKQLIAHTVQVVRDYGLDGCDIDYEEYDQWDQHYPQLLAFVKGLREAQPKDKLLTCAVNSRWLRFTPEWEASFDYINLMSYDRGAFTSKPVQHASYEDFVKDLDYWLHVCKAPKHKIVGGVPFYGYSWDESMAGIVDSSRGVRYHTLLKVLGNQAADTDQIGKTYYNGRPTIRRKCEYVREQGFGGVMIWQLFQDAYMEQASYSLLKVIQQSVRK